MKIREKRKKKANKKKKDNKRKTKMFVLVRLQLIFRLVFLVKARFPNTGGKAKLHSEKHNSFRFESERYRNNSSPKVNRCSISVSCKETR